MNATTANEMTATQVSAMSADRKKSYRSFGAAAGLWLLAIMAVTALAAPREDLYWALGWTLGLWAVSVADLAVLAKAVSCVLELATATAENRGTWIIQASYWGFLKLACLGIFATVLIMGHEIPVTSLLTGVGTMVFVPLVGGLWWSKRI
jgi:hypothetical protein